MLAELDTWRLLTLFVQKLVVSVMHQEGNPCLTSEYTKVQLSWWRYSSFFVGSVPLYRKKWDSNSKMKTKIENMLMSRTHHLWIWDSGLRLFLIFLWWLFNINMQAIHAIETSLSCPRNLQTHFRFFVITSSNLLILPLLTSYYFDRKDVEWEFIQIHQPHESNLQISAEHLYNLFLIIILAACRLAAFRLLFSSKHPFFKRKVVVILY